MSLRRAIGSARPSSDRGFSREPGRAGGKTVPNITPDPESGIGKWSEDDIITFLKDGQTPDFDFVGGAMAEIVRNTSRLTDEDRRAIASLSAIAPAYPFRKNGEQLMNRVFRHWTCGLRFPMMTPARQEEFAMEPRHQQRRRASFARLSDAAAAGARPMAIGRIIGWR